MTELATFKPYGPPYWEKRVWNPAGRNAWEKRMLMALELQNEDALNTLLDRREFRQGRPTKWHKPYGKTRAFALDIWGDIMQGHRLVRQTLTPQRLFQEWRAEGARMAEAADVERDQHDDVLHNWEEATAKLFQARKRRHGYT